MKSKPDIISQTVEKICTFNGIGTEHLDLYQRKAIIQAVKLGFAEGLKFKVEGELR